METPYASDIILGLFILGLICCILALITIRTAPGLQSQFGVLCKWQMLADIAQLVLITGFCLLSKEIAPSPNSLLSIIPCQAIETLYFFTGQLHVLMAVHRFVFVVIPNFAHTWKRRTKTLLIICTVTSIGRILLMTGLDRGMYYVYVRETSLWFITVTPWTHFYETYLEFCWSIGEMVAILVLDFITLTRLISWRSLIGKERAATLGHIEVRLVLQSLCQCVPTGLITILYFKVFPNVQSQFIKFMCSSFILSFGNVLDAFFIIIFHLRIRLFRKPSVGVDFTSTNAVQNRVPEAQP